MDDIEEASLLASPPCPARYRALEPLPVRPHLDLSALDNLPIGEITQDTEFDVTDIVMAGDNVLLMKLKGSGHWVSMTLRTIGEGFGKIVAIPAGKKFRIEQKGMEREKLIGERSTLSLQTLRQMRTLSGRTIEILKGIEQDAKERTQTIEKHLLEVLQFVKNA